MSNRAISHLESVLLVLLGLSLTLVYSNFIIDLGNYKTQIYGSLFVLLLIVAIRPGRTIQTLASNKIKFLIGVPVALLLLGLLPTPAHAPQKRYLQSLAYFVVLSLSLGLVLERMSKRQFKLMHTFLMFFFGAGVLYHLEGLNTFIPESGHYWNPHYLAQFSLFSLLFFGYALMKRRTKTIWAVGLLLSAGAIYLLLISQSRPAWLSLFISLCLITSLYAKRNKRWIYLGLILLFFVLVYLLMPDVVAKRVDDLAFNIQKEERVAIWLDGLNMQMKAAWQNWLVGHGPGSYFAYAQAYPSYFDDIRFPHNFFIEIVFESGLIGLIIVAAAYIVLFTRMHRFVLDNPQQRLAMVTLLAMLTSHLLFCFLTMPFYFNNTVLLQAPIIASVLYLTSENRRTETTR